jgi:small GTP-binding protein
MVGSFAVGKTSLVRQFVHGTFSEEYMTTLGVQIKKKTVELSDEIVEAMLWDIHGDDKFKALSLSYLKGTAGYLLVIDGTRNSTCEVALELREKILNMLGPIPYGILINKVDLRDTWEVSIDSLHATNYPPQFVHETSAKTGEHVESSFVKLCESILKKRIT